MIKQEGNIIIAKYEGWKVSCDTTFASMLRVNTRNPEGNCVSSCTIDNNVDNLLKKEWNDLVNEDWGRCRYHKSWDRLIPIVKKVQKELWDMKLRHPDSAVGNDLRNAVNELEIEPVWKATVAGIQMVNKYKAQESIEKL